MAITRITKGVIKPNENYDTHNIVSTGIVTSVGLDVNGNADVSGSLSVGGVLTYEDVTSIDSVGIITAQKDIHVGAGVSAVGVGTFGGLVSPYADIDDFVSVGNNIHLGNAGVITATSFVGSGAALTGIDATAVKDSGGNVKIQAQASGAMYTGIHTFGTNTNFTDIDVDGHTNLDNVNIAGIVTVTTSTQYDGFNLSNGTNLVAELVGLSGTNDTGGLALWNGGSKYVNIIASGNSYINGGKLGIGTDNPTKTLQVFDSSATSTTARANTVARFLSNASNADCNIQLSNGVDHSAQIGIVGNGADVYIAQDGVEKLRITSAGRVGINETSPDSPLHVSTNTDGTTDILTLHADADGTNNGVASIKLMGNTGNHAAFIKGGHTTNGDTILTFHTDAHDSGINPEERLRITSGGNIGVAGATGTDFSLLDGMVINTANGSAGLLINSSSSSHNAYLGFSYGSGSSTSHADQYSAYIGRVGDNNLILGTNNNIRVTIDSNGLVAMGGNANLLDSVLSITNSVGDCIRLRSNTTNNTFKYGVIKVDSYGNSSNGVQIIGGKSDSSYNEVAIGGGVDTGYAATQIKFLTAANTTTQPGTERLRITSAGKMVSTISSPDPYNTIQTNLELVNGAGNQGAGSRIDFSVGNGKAHIQSQVIGGNSNSGAGLVFATSPDANGADERLRIDSSGRLLVGTTNAANSHVAASKATVHGHLSIFKDSEGDNAGVNSHQLKFVTQSGSIAEIQATSAGGGGPSGRGGYLSFYAKPNNNPTLKEMLRVGDDIVTILRENTGNEGGHIGLARASDNAAYWNIDSYGSTSQPDFRIHAGGTSHFAINANGQWVEAPTGTVIKVGYARYDPNNDSYVSIGSGTKERSGVALDYTCHRTDSKLYIMTRMHTRMIAAYGCSYGIDYSTDSGSSWTVMDGMAASGRNAMDFFYKGDGVNHHYTGFCMRQIDAYSGTRRFSPWGQGWSGGTWEVSYGHGEHSVTIYEVAV